IKEEAPVKSTQKKAGKKQPEQPGVNVLLKKLIISSINDLAEEHGWVFLSTIGKHIIKKEPSFDPRNYGFKKLLDIIKNISEIEIEERASGKNSVAHLWVRVK
ncbi:MAG TPA: OST-HTH/LOTUS domain-containing protein, partial [Ferruginibacter sp.]|nr:OST-HTH/LOTUS domain-containing protein [Ferruginibacter sp.]